eukprot:CAMPEP_0184473532 /NCGR_PEP_ID=MMETSP0740-20130409/124249_1 /TAXON_ID=385413 /ORGANISM="Thalassiosira miniscula, Strain CCMP1093" /LENGTH=40 /DNA_ID= /DNA_START= /DNA_END= /DNA_ORIENTATION=
MDRQAWEEVSLPVGITGPGGGGPLICGVRSTREGGAGSGT